MGTSAFVGKFAPGFRTIRYCRRLPTTSTCFCRFRWRNEANTQTRFVKLTRAQLYRPTRAQIHDLIQDSGSDRKNRMEMFGDSEREMGTSSTCVCPRSCTRFDKHRKQKSNMQVKIHQQQKRSPESRLSAFTETRQVTLHSFLYPLPFFSFHQLSVFTTNAYKK